MAAAEEYKIKIAKTSLGYNLVKTGVIANGMICAMNAPLNNVKTFLKNSFCRIFLSFFSKMLDVSCKNIQTKINKDRFLKLMILLLSYADVFESVKRNAVIQTNIPEIKLYKNLNFNSLKFQLPFRMYGL
jgi:hypothetical protein